MFLSRAAITKQLFYEFLCFDTLALDPGKPVELCPDTLLGSSSNADLGSAIEFAERQLRVHLGGQEGLQDKQEQFNTLLSSLVAYKKVSQASNNPFSEYAQADATLAHPCAWLVFAPLVIDEPKGSNLSFETEHSFIEYLKKPKTGFRFDTKCTVDKTGLFIAVQTNNHEMVDAFLCPDFYGYQLTTEDLKKLLSLTHDPKTRIALFRHSRELLNWIAVDKELQVSCVLSFEELSGLWSYLPKEQRKEFIKNTNSQLWLNLLDKALGKQKIEKLLGPDFDLPNAKLLQDSSIKNSEFIHKTIQYLNKEQQFDYLRSIDINKQFPQPRGLDWNKLLSSLGYKISKEGRLTTLRYVLPEVVARVHNNLINVLISLPVETRVIIETLEKIETYIHRPTTEGEYTQYLNRIAKDVVQKEYETGFFIINWFNKLLRFLNFKSESPLHPYIDRLTQVIKKEPLVIIPGELMGILPPAEDYEIYKGALSAYFEKKIDIFWLKLPKKDRDMIIHDPIRFEALVRFFSAPVDNRPEFFKALDADSLKYFNTAKGLRQLILDTPSFNAARDFPLLINAMETTKIMFLEDPSIIIELLLENNEGVFKQIAPFFPFKLNNSDSLSFQAAVLGALPKPLQKEHFNRFLQAYCADAHHFSALLVMMNNSNPVLVTQCWEQVPDTVWTLWYTRGLEHAELWSQTLKHLQINDRLDFFEKLTSGGKLTAEEFCDFLLDKNEAVFNSLWSKVPVPQWSTWIKESQLPPTTLSLLSTMAYPLRVQFFKAMLTMTRPELESFCVTPDKTVEQFYPEEVKSKMAVASTSSDAKAKLAKLKDDKLNEFNNGIQELTKSINELSTQLEKIRNTNIKAHNNWGLYFVSFWKTDPYYGFVTSINANSKVISKLHTQILSYPLLAVQSKAAREFIELGEAMEQIRNHINVLKDPDTKMPADLKKAVDGIDLTFKKLKAINPIPSPPEEKSTITTSVTNTM